MIKKRIAVILMIMSTTFPIFSFAKHQPSVIIIGAGVAGLSAAQTLANQPISVLVLEARNRIGGRIHTIAPWGPALDLGAAWIHGIEHSPIKALTKKYHFQTVPTIYNDNAMLNKFKSFHLYQEDGKTIDHAQLKPILSLAQQFEDYVENHTHDFEPLSLEEALTRFISLHKDTLNKTTELLFRYVITNINLYDFGADLSHLSANADAVYQHSVVSGQNELFTHGYSQILTPLAANISIKLNQAVNKIKYGQNGVDIYTQQHHYHADYVIVTVPLGVLKSGAITFLPPLPPAKQAAIHDLAVSTYEKTYLLFDHVFWDKQAEWIGYVSKTQSASESLDIMNAYKFTQSPILLAFTAGSFGKQANQWDDTKKINYIMDILKKIYGKHIPQPSAYVTTHWDSDPFSRGAYAYLPTGASAKHFQRLAQPVMNKLFFAGEATSSTDPGTVHGAYLSGKRAAEKIIHLHQHQITHDFAGNT